MLDPLSQLAYTAHVLSRKDMPNPVERDQPRKYANPRTGAFQSQPGRQETGMAGVDDNDSDEEYGYTSGAAEGQSTDNDAAALSGGGAAGSAAMHEGSQRQAAGGLATPRAGRLAATPQSAFGRSTGGGDYMSSERERGVHETGRSPSRDDCEGSHGGGAGGRRGWAPSVGGGGGGAVSGGGSKRTTSRRPVQFWGAFNDWWRSEFARTGKRPTGDLVGAWYAAHAVSTWGTDAPSLEETRTHAKCLRSVGSIREYFREYRARKKARVEDGPAGTSNPGTAGTPPAGGFSAGGAAPHDLAALSSLLPQLDALGMPPLSPLSPLQMMTAMGGAKAGPSGSAAAGPFFGMPDLEALQTAGLALGPDGGGAVGRFGSSTPGNGGGKRDRTAFYGVVSRYISTPRGMPRQLLPPDGLAPVPVAELDTGAAGGAAGGGGNTAGGGVLVPMPAMPLVGPLQSGPSVPRATVSTVTTGSLGRSGTGFGLQDGGHAGAVHRAPAVTTATPAGNAGAAQGGGRGAADCASAGGGIEAPPAAGSGVRSRPSTPPPSAGAPREIPLEEQRLQQFEGRSLQPAGPFAFRAGSASGCGSGSDGGRSCGSTPPPVSRPAPAVLRDFAQHQPQHSHLQPQQPQQQRRLSNTSDRAGPAAGQPGAGLLPQQLLAMMPHSDGAVVVHVAPRSSATQLMSTAAVPGAAPHRQQQQQQVASHHHGHHQRHHQLQAHQQLYVRQQRPTQQHEQPLGQQERRSSYSNETPKSAFAQEGTIDALGDHGGEDAHRLRSQTDVQGRGPSQEASGLGQHDGQNRVPGTASPFAMPMLSLTAAPVMSAGAAGAPCTEAADGQRSENVSQAHNGGGQSVEAQAEDVTAKAGATPPPQQHQHQLHLKVEPLPRPEMQFRAGAKPHGLPSSPWAGSPSQGRNNSGLYLHHQRHYQASFGLAQQQQPHDLHQQPQHPDQMRPTRAASPPTRPQHTESAAHHPGSGQAPGPDPADSHYRQHHQYPSAAMGAGLATAAAAMPSLRVLLARPDGEAYGMLDELSREQLVVLLHKAVAMIRQKKAHEERLMDELAQVLEQQGNLQAQLHVQRMEMARMYRAYVTFRDDRSSGGGTTGGGGPAGVPGLAPSGAAGAMAAAVAAGGAGGGGFTSSAVSPPRRSSRSALDAEGEPSHMTTHGQQPPAAAAADSAAGRGGQGPAAAGASGVNGGASVAAVDQPPSGSIPKDATAAPAPVASMVMAEDACPEGWPPQRSSEEGATIGRPATAEPASPSAFGGFSSNHSIAPTEWRVPATVGAVAAASLVEAPSAAAASLSLSVGLGAVAQVGNSPTVLTRHGIAGSHPHPHTHGHDHAHGSGGGSVDGAAAAKVPAAVLACSDGGSGTSSAF